MILIILTCWAVLTTLVIAICVASSMRNDAETEALALLTSNAPQPEFIEASPAPKGSIGDLSYT